METNFYCVRFWVTDDTGGCEQTLIVEAKSKLSAMGLAIIHNNKSDPDKQLVFSKYKTTRLIKTNKEQILDA